MVVTRTADQRRWCGSVLFSGDEPYKKKTVDKVIDFDASEGDTIVIADDVDDEL